MIDGVEIKLGEKNWIIPPLNLKGVRKTLNIFKESGEELDIANPATVFRPGQMDMISKIVHLAIVRNYPEVTIDEVEELVDLGNVQKVIPAIMGQSGLMKQGEAVAGSQLTGTTSTLT